MAEYTLPDLPYDYAALEPHVSAQIMELHHDKHHAAYVTGANQTLEKLAAARDKDDFGAIVGLEKTLAFHISGHVLHSIFWKNQSPDGGDKPDGALGSAIDENFGSFDKFKAHFTQATMTIQGSGWGVLAYEPLAGRLIIEQVYDHQSNIGQRPPCGTSSTGPTWRAAWTRPRGSRSRADPAPALAPALGPASSLPVYTALPL
jgi:Fe-Mn family superoxide dismutase